MAQQIDIVDYQTPYVFPVGFVYQVPNNATVSILNPPGPLASLTILMPPTPANFQIWTITSTEPIASVTQTVSIGQILNGPLTTMLANTAYGWVYLERYNTWFVTTGVGTAGGTVVSTITGTVNQVAAVQAPSGTVTLTLSSTFISPGSITSTTTITAGTGLTLTYGTPDAFIYSGAAGTVLTTAQATDGQLLVGSTGAAPVAATLTAGPGISITNGPGSITINNTGVTQLIAGTNISISPVGGTGVVTITSTGQSPLQLYAENPVSPSPPSATGVNSVAILSASSATAQDSLAIGVQSISRIEGGVVQASGRFASSGDAQTGRYLLRTVTISNVPTTMFVDGTAGSVTVTMPDNST